jgi:acyl carrier protein
MSTEASIREFILENYLFTDDDSELKNEESLIDSGVIDSTGIMEVIAFLQKEFEIVVEDEEMIPENLDSVDNIMNYLKKKGVDTQ